jgi:hypothetical protein
MHLIMTFFKVYNELFKTHVRWFAILGLIIGGVLAKTLTVPDYILAYVFSMVGGIITYIFRCQGSRSALS